MLCVRHAEGGARAPVRSTDRRIAHSSPTPRDDFVRGDSSGARPAYFVCFTFSRVPALAVELNRFMALDLIFGAEKQFSEGNFPFYFF